MTAATTSPFAGSWQLTEALDEEMKPVSLPDGTFVLEIQEDDKNDKELQVFMKIGNRLRTTISLDGDVSTDPETGDASSDVTVSGVMSTMMMPPEPLFKLETFLFNTLPKMTSIKVQNSAAQLTLRGLGQFTCTKFEGDLED